MRMELTLQALRDAVENHAAIRRIQRLTPAGGPGDKVFPPTYAGLDDKPCYITEQRRINGADVPCVLLDSVQSQANRLEEALLKAVRRGLFKLPYISVDFSGQKGANQIEIGDLGEVTSLDAPHRVFDAIIRDSQLDGTKFTDTDYYRELVLAKPSMALPVFKWSPTSLIFGAWNSTGGAGLGARFARCLVSEIVGVNAVTGHRGAVRIDPLGIRADVKIVGGPIDWRIARDDEKTNLNPSKINHSNILARYGIGGVTIDYAVHTVVVSCTGLRRLKFADSAIRDEAAGRALLASLALLAIVLQDSEGYSLRSRCDLVSDRTAPFEVVRHDGSSEQFGLVLEQALDLFSQSVEEARNAGFPWETEPIRLKPQPRLVELVALSRARALKGEPEPKEGVSES